MGGTFIITDLDGTLCNDSRRLARAVDKIAKQGLLYSREEIWNEYHAAFEHDDHHPNVLKYLQLFEGTSVFLGAITYRPVRFHQATLFWLRRRNLNCSFLWMRPRGCLKPEPEMKRDGVHYLTRTLGAKVLFAIDNNPDVAAMWASEGVSCVSPDALQFVEP